MCMERNSNHCRDLLKVGEPFDLGGSKVLLSLSPDTAERRVRTFAIRVLKPTPGIWEVDFRYDVHLRLVRAAVEPLEAVMADLDVELTTRDRPKGEVYRLPLRMNRRSKCVDAVVSASNNRTFCPDDTGPFKFTIK